MCSLSRVCLSEQTVQTPALHFHSRREACKQGSGRLAECATRLSIIHEYRSFFASIMIDMHFHMEAQDSSLQTSGCRSILFSLLR